MDGVKELLPKVSGSDPTFEFEFCITNMEDITKMATEGGDHAQVVHLLRTADVSRYPFILDIFLHTLSGRFTHTLVYSTSFKTSNIAELYFEKIRHYFHASLEI